MSRYLMTLTPQEPYFFGNEKTFRYPGAKSSGRGNRYYIKSEQTPAQTTWIGALRYLLLPIKKQFGQYSADDIEVNAKAVGPKSFEYGGENEFGAIRSISPMFLLRNDQEPLVVTPFDHVNGKEFYTAFADYVEISEGARCYPVQYNAKDGVSHSYMSLDSGKIYSASELFTVETRIGINRSAKEEGFFKKDYVNLAKGYSFASYVTLEDGVTPQDSLIYLGQGKSLFMARFVSVEGDPYGDMTAKLAALLYTDVVYCMSDAFLPNPADAKQSDDGIYAGTKFAVTDLREYRAYTTNEGKIRKASILYHLIRAGSIFVPKSEDFVDAFQDGSVQIIGYNEIIQGIKEREKK